MRRVVLDVVSDSEGGWIMRDDHGETLDPDTLKFNRETGDFEAELLEEALDQTDEDPGISITTTW